MTGRLLLLDSASMYFRAFFGMPEYAAPDGTNVNAVRGMLDYISRLVEQYRPSDLVCCWDDDWRPQWRVDLIPSYKAHRVVEVVPGAPDVEEVPDPLELQVPILREVLGAFGICVIGAEHAEADDVIGTLATGAGQPVDVVTGDRDLFQLVDDAADVRVLYIGKGVGRHEVVTEGWILDKYGITAAQYADFATLRGDASDGLPGVKGVGEKTAATLLQRFGDIDGIVAAAQRPGVRDGSRPPRQDQGGRRLPRGGPAGGGGRPRPRPRPQRDRVPRHAGRPRPRARPGRAVGPRDARHPPGRRARAVVTPFDITSAPTARLRFAIGATVAFTVVCVAIAVGCFAGLLTQSLDAGSRFTAVVIGVIAALGGVRGVRTVRAARELGEPVVLARLDAEGLHLHDAAGVAGVPDDQAWTHVPWAWITSVSHTSFDLRSVKKLGGGDTPIDVLRFVVGDDALLDGDGRTDRGTHLLGRWLGLTPAQLRTVLVGERGDESHRGAVAWLAANRPDLPVVTGTTSPWSTKASPDPWAGRPRVAVLGAHGRLGRHLVDVVVRRDDVAPVAVVRNEAHRGLLERAGAEVRMVDLELQDAPTIGDALRGCTAVVLAAPTSVEVFEEVLEGARRARVSRFVLVASRQDGTLVSRLASSGLDWTVFRPDSLTGAAATGEVALGPDVVPGPVPRADLAEVVVASIRDEDSVGDVWPISGAGSPVDLDKP